MITAKGVTKGVHKGVPGRGSVPTSKGVVQTPSPSPSPTPTPSPSPLRLCSISISCTYSKARPARLTNMRKSFSLRNVMRQPRTFEKASTGDQFLIDNPDVLTALDLDYSLNTPTEGATA